MASDEKKLLESIAAVFEFCSQYEKHSAPLATGTGRIRIVCQYLNSIRECILESIPLESYPKLDSSISWGSGYFPRVPWIGFHLLGKKVSNSLSVVICFSRDGRGIVVGMMSAAILKTDLKTVARTTQEEFLDINGSVKTSYNNKFINPKVFFGPKINIQNLISHITSSLDLLYRQQSSM